jgi:hypothetical protein
VTRVDRTLGSSAAPWRSDRVGLLDGAGGWVFDPDSGTAASQVHVYVDGRGAAVVEDRSRPDVGAVFPGAGDDHGFSHSGVVTAGTHTVCLYVIGDQIGWLNTPLGCRSVTT